MTDALVGRDEEVQWLMDTLKARKTVVVWGGPGEGKSAVAAEAACRLWESGGAPGGVVRADFAGASAVALHSGVQAELAVPDLSNEACMPAGAQPGVPVRQIIGTLLMPYWNTGQVRWELAVSHCPSFQN